MEPHLQLLPVLQGRDDDPEDQQAAKREIDVRGAGMTAVAPERIGLPAAAR